MDKIKQFFEKILNTLKDFFEKPVNGYADFLNKTFGLNVEGKEQLFFWVSIAAIAVLFILLIVIISVASKSKKKKKEIIVPETEEDKVEDAISLIEEHYDEKPSNNIIIDSIPPINATTIEQSKPAIVKNTEIEAVNERKEEFDKGDSLIENAPKTEPIYVEPVKETPKKEVKRVEQPRTDTARVKIRIPAGDYDDRPVVLKKAPVKKAPVVEEDIDDEEEFEEIVPVKAKASKPAPVKKQEPIKTYDDEDDDIDTVDFLAAALMKISEEYDKKLAEALEDDNKYKTNDEEPTIEDMPVEADVVTTVKIEEPEIVVEEPVKEEPKQEVIEEVKKEDIPATIDDIQIKDLKEEDEEPKKEPAKKTSAKKAPAKKAPVKKTPVKKAPAKKEPVKKEEPKPVEDEEKKKTPATGKFTIAQEGDDFRYRLVASNGENLFTSEPYISEISARNGIKTLKKQVEIAIIDIVEDKHGLFSFRVITRQGRCLGTSANYPNKANTESAIESFKKFIQTDKIEFNQTAEEHFDAEEYTADVPIENNGKYRIVEKDNKYVYQLLASNGRVIATSNIYSSKDSCFEGFEKFRMVVYDGSFVIYRDKNDKFQFKLYNKQKRLILVGEVYDDKQRAISVVESIKKYTKKAKYVD